jgi:hypothetical protein
MADQPISGLTALTAAATGDLLEIVDVSDTTMAATGTNKKITAGQVLASGLPGSFSTLAASGAATLSSAGGDSLTLAPGAGNSVRANMLLRGTTAGGAVVNAYIGQNIYGTAAALELKSNGNVGIEIATTGAVSMTSGLAVTGALSASGTVTYSSAQNRLVQSTSGATTGYVLNECKNSVGTLTWGVANDAGVFWGGGGSAGNNSGNIGTSTNVNLGFAVNDTRLMTLSSTTLAMTGAITASTTGKVGTTLGVGGATPSASGAGITFPATVSASTDVNTLDDYDEYTAASAACTGAITTAAVWKLTKVGNVVTLTLPAVTGTATAVASFTFGTAIPAKYRAASSTQFICSVYDNGAAKTTPGVVFIDASGNIYVMANLNRTTAYTAAAAAGLEYITAVSWTI